MKSLKRIQVGDFKIENSITLKNIANNFFKNSRTVQNTNIDKEQKVSNTENLKLIEDNLISVEKVFEKNESINLNSKKLQLFLNGVKITQNQANGVYKIYNQDSKFIGTGIIENNLLKRDVIL